MGQTRREGLRRVLAGLGCVALLAGCGGDTGAGPGDELDPAALAEALAAADAFVPGRERWRCPSGGDGSSDVRQSAVRFHEGGEQTITLIGELAYDGCGTPTSAGLFELKGSLEFTTDIAVDPFGRATGVESRLSGVLGWRLDGRSGACPLDVMASRLNLGDTEVTGVICGAEVRVTIAA